MHLRLPLLAALLIARPLLGQVAGRVVGSGDAPIPGAIVTLWRGSREVARALASERGAFHFDSLTSATATGLVVRRIGFSPRSLALFPAADGEPRTELLVELTPLLATLPEVVVREARAVCPAREDPAARRLWEALRARYRLHPRSVGQHSEMMYALEDVSGSAVGEIDETRLRWGRYEVTAAGRLGMYAGLDSGYASRLPPPTPGQPLLRPQFLHWWYAPLHREAAEHFLEAAFGAHHDLSLRPQSGGAVRLVYCGRGKGPRLEGTMTVQADTTLEAASWRFVTPTPREDAGGEVVFAPPAGAPPYALAAARGAYWRRMGGRSDRYVQEVAVYRTWLWGSSSPRCDTLGPCP